MAFLKVDSKADKWEHYLAAMTKINLELQKVEQWVYY